MQRKGKTLYAEGVYLMKYREEHSMKREQHMSKGLRIGIFERFKGQTI